MGEVVRKLRARKSRVVIVQFAIGALVFGQPGGILQVFLNSMYVTLVSVLLIRFLSSVFRYIIVKRDTKGCRILACCMRCGSIAPFAALPTMQMQMLKMMGIYGGQALMIFVYGALNLPFFTMWYFCFLTGIPRELEDAAIIDGSTGGKLFLTVILQLFVSDFWGQYG